MLAELEPRVVKIGDQPARLYLGAGTPSLEVVIVHLGGGRPGIGELRSLLKKRTAGRATPVLIVVPWGDGRAAVCGPIEDDPWKHPDLSATQVESLCRKALAAPAHHDAVRLLQRLLPELEAPIPGLRNEGFFAMQELVRGVPGRHDWDLAGRRARAVRCRRGRTLIEGLGFQVKDLAGPGILLVAGERKTAVAVLVDRPEELDSASARFDGATAVSYALRQADLNNVDWVIAVADATLRLYPVAPGVGTARRGRLETFVEINIELCSRDHAAYLWLLFSASALLPQGTVDEIRRLSADYAADLSGRLRERVYAEVMPLLCRAVVAGGARLEARPTVTELRESYQTAVYIIYRLLFVAYAEDRGLLPLHTSQSYREHSLKRLGQRLLKARQGAICFGGEGSYWAEIQQLWKAVSVGHAEWGIPPYNGALFSSDAEVSPIGAKIAHLTLPDRAFAPALAALVLDRTAEENEGPVDFRSLGVREFGTIYEGLLESELSVADTDLKVNPKTGAYLPAKKGDAIEVEAGEVYLHNQSGARKSSGGYYTPHFVVEHLLDRVLDPALDDHCKRLDGLSIREAGEHFFKFRVADIAMGSGHFLVGAVDRIERCLTNYLVDRPLPDVRAELGRLRATAKKRQGWPDEIEDAQLLRRQVARRCIFGVDVNPMAVELARLSVWIHTFVPGLPLSLLDQNLIHGNSLVGIGSFDEADELMQVGALKLVSASAKKRMEAVRKTLERLAVLTDANDAEIREARTLWNEYRDAMRPEHDRFTMLAASRTNGVIQKAIETWKMATDTEGLEDDCDWAERLEREQDQLIQQGRDEFKDIDVVHFPLAFPHVFREARGGFDVILGNPPWEKVTVEEHAFWARYFPGLRGCPQREREVLKARYREERPDLVAALNQEIEITTALRRLVTQGAFPGMGAGAPDLHKAFAWRFWGLAASEGGRIGVVLPREAWSAYGSTKFRETVLAGAREIDVTMLTNTGQWVFGMEPRYTVGLTSITKHYTKATGGGDRLSTRFRWNTGTARTLRESPAF